MLTVGSLFAGIGGFDLGLERAGWRCAWQVEADRRIVEAHQAARPPAVAATDLPEVAG